MMSTIICPCRNCNNQKKLCGVQKTLGILIQICFYYDLLLSTFVENFDDVFSVFLFDCADITIQQT